MDKRWLLGLTLLVTTSGAGCAKKAKTPFTCERFQQRAERCERYLLSAVDRRVQGGVATGDVDADEQKDRSRKYKVGLLRSIRANGVKKLCEKVQHQSTREARKRYTNMKYCFRRPGCKAFARCSLGIW